MPDRAAVDPARTALLVMDYQNGILDSLDGAGQLLDIVVGLLALARERAVQVGFVRVGFTEDDLAAMPATSAMAAAARGRGAAMHADAPQTQVHEAIRPAPDDIVVRKTRVGAFSTTDLHDRLRDKGIDTLLLAGISTSGVVLSTVRDAADRDYRVLVVGDACADRDPAVHDVLLTRVFPRQATVVSAADVDTLLR